MGVFNPEEKELRESAFEAKRFSLDMEDRLRMLLEQPGGRFPDLLQCPAKSCANPLTLTREKDRVRLHCSFCGWEHVVVKKMS